MTDKKETQTVSIQLTTTVTLAKLIDKESIHTFGKVNRSATINMILQAYFTKNA